MAADCMLVLLPALMNIISTTAEDVLGNPSKRFARHTTSVPLYSDLTGMDGVFTVVPFSLIEPTVMSKYCPAGDPLTLQLINTLIDG